MKWAEIEVRCAPESVDAVSALLTAIGCGGTAIRDDQPSRERDRAEEALPLSARSPQPSALSPHPSQVLGYLPVDDRLEDSLAELRARLAELPGLGLEVVEGVTLRT